MDTERRLQALEEWRDEFNDKVIDRLARIETKVDSITKNGNSGGGGGSKGVVADVLKVLTYLVVGLVGVLTGRQIPQ